MINFRYHIVSLVAVFIALSVGIAVGVSLSPSVDEGIITQADQDRERVNELRTELDRRNALDVYRNTYEQQVGDVVMSGELSDTRVALVTMPDAPGAVREALETAVEDAGGQVVANVEVGEEVFDPQRTEQVDEDLAALREALGYTDGMSSAYKFGLALGRAVAAKGAGTRDADSQRAGQVLSSNGLANVRGDVSDTAQLVIIVTAPATTPPEDTEVLEAHVQAAVAVKQQDSVAVVLAGPDSNGIEGTDVLTARTTSDAQNLLSTVDVADLPSGITTTVLAGREQVLGRQGHYGALARTDSALPSLPVR